MKALAYALLALLPMSLGAAAGDWEFAYRPASIGYALYGNTLGDPGPPSKADTKVAFEVRGQVARDIFEAIGPDKVDSCVQEAGARFRSRDEQKIACIRNNEGKYACYFGFDLKSGKSIGGSIC